MSNLLEQAIVDAKALKEAAMKNAESSILEKYSAEMKEVVDSLLSEEEDPFALDELGEDLAEGEEDPDAVVPTVPAAEGVCPCPDIDNDDDPNAEQNRIDIDLGKIGPPGKESDQVSSTGVVDALGEEIEIDFDMLEQQILAESDEDSEETTEELTEETTEELTEETTEGDDEDDDISDDLVNKIIEKFGSEIYRNESLHPSIHQGFPLPAKVLVERYERMSKMKTKSTSFKRNIRGFRGNMEEKINQLVLTRLTSSRLRFSSQFIGKSLEKDHGRVYSGACFEMGLLVARGEKKDLEITLSKNGLEFVRLENPAINFVDTGDVVEDHYARPDDGIVNFTFSNKEIDFIQNRILSRYELENNIITTFSKKSWIEYGGKDGDDPTDSKPAMEGGDFVPELKEIFEDEKKKYLIQNYPDIMATKEKFSISDNDVRGWLAKKKAVDEQVPPKIRKKEIAKNLRFFEGHSVSEKDVLGYLVDKHLLFQLTGTLSRMRELKD